MNAIIAAASYEPVTPDDANDLPQLTQAIILDGAATIKLTQPAGKVVTLQLPAGRHELAVKRIWATSLTAGVHVTAIYG